MSKQLKLLNVKISILLLLLAGCASRQTIPVREAPELQNKYSIGMAEYRPKQLFPRSMFEI
ncbi:hypothetical protein [Microbulbifer sp. JMSA003]|uniref:hypothetical protein n=1 Tax=Microbulbifer sp. JMSA003 TaxID=3243369 RepID=UPI004039092D